MKTRITKTLALLAAFCGLQLFAATPIAVFTEDDLKDAKVLNDITLSYNNSATFVERSGLTPAHIEMKSDATKGIWLANRNFNSKNLTVVIQYSNFPAADNSKDRVMLVFGGKDNSTDPNNDRRDYCGVLATKAGTGVFPMWGVAQRWNKGSENTDVVPSTGSDIKRMALAYTYDSAKSGDANGVTAYVDGTKSYNNSGLRGDLYTRDIGIFGCYYETSSTVCPAVGAKIYGIAVFNEKLTKAEIDAYEFPTKYVTVTNARWGNIGDAANGGCATTMDRMGTCTFTVSFADTQNICTRQVGASGTFLLKKVRLISRHNDTTYPTTLTITPNGGTAVSTTNVTTTDPENSGIYKADHTTLVESSKTRKYVDFTFDTPIELDTSKTFTWTTDKGLGCMKPSNTTMNYSASGSSYNVWSPAVEFIGDYTFVGSKPKYLQNLYHTGDPIDGWANWTQTNGANIPGTEGTSGTLTMNGVSLAVSCGGGNFKPSVTGICDGYFANGTYADIYGNTHMSLLEEVSTSLGSNADISQVLKTGLANGARGGTDATATISGLTVGTRYVFYFGCGTYGTADTASGPGFQLNSAGCGTVESLNYVVTVACSDSGTKATSVATSYQPFSVGEIVRAGSASSKGGMLMVRAVLTPNSEGKIVFYPNAKRSVLSFIAIAEAPEVEGVDYEGTITSTPATWSTKQGITSEDEWISGPNSTITLGNTAVADATLTFDEDVQAAKFTLTSDAEKNTTLAKSNNATLDIAAYDFSGANGKSTVGYDTGTATIKAGADTVLNGTGTGTLTIDANKQATVKNWSGSNLSGAGTVVYNADAAATAVSPGAFSGGFTGSIKLTQGTWTVTGNFPQQRNITVDGVNAKLTLNGGDVTGYSGTFPHLVIQNGGTLYFQKRDTFSREIELKNGAFVDLGGNRTWDLYSNSKINVYGSGTTSVIGGTTRYTTTNSGSVCVRRSNLETWVESGATLAVYAQWGDTADGRGNACLKTGPGTVEFYRASVQTGAYTINAGTVKMVNAGSPTTGSIVNNATLELNATEAQTVSNAISGSGSVTKTGDATTTLTGANTYSGGTTVSAGMLVAATANLGTGLVTINDGATLKLILTEAQVEGSSTVFKSSQDAATLQARVTIVNEAGVTIPGNFSKGENDAVVFTPSVELYSLTITDGQTLNWGDNIWTKGGQGGQPYAPAEGKVGDVTITVNGTATLNVTNTPAQLGGIKFVKADGASTANITVKYATTTPPTSSAVNVTYNVFGMVPTVGDGVTYAFEPALDATKFAWECNQAAGTFFATKRPEMGSISIKIGARTESAGKILTSLESVGAVQLSGLLWTNAKLYTETKAADPGYTDIGKVSDANGSGRQVRYAFRGPNTYWSSSDSSTGNAVLTKTYVDDGDDAASKTWTISDESKLPGESVTLPAAPNARGWQIHLDNLPYAAFDLYFITASDQAAANLKETPILLSANGGTTWVSYTADTTTHKTKLGDTSWNGSPWTSGQLAEGLNYLKMRVSAAIMGVEQISALEITHGLRSTSGTVVRSGLCAIQIVELNNDGAFTLTGNGNWTTDAIWSSGGQAGKTWESGEESYATILSSDTINAVKVDGNVTAKKVTLKGTHDFALDGANTITSEMGIDAAEFTGALTLKAPVVGPISLNSDATIVFNNADTETPVEGAAYAFTGSAAFKKTGAGAYTLNATGVTGMTVEAGTLKLGADCTISGTIEVQSGATLDLNGHSLAGLTITGAGTVTGSFAGGTLAPAADTTLTFSGTVAENATLTINGEGTVRITSAQANGTIAVTAGTLEATSLKTLSLGANATLKIAKDATLTLTDVPTFNAASKIIIADAASLVEGNNYKLVTWTNWPNCDLLSYGMPQLDIEGYTGTKANVRLVPGVYDLTLQCRTAAQVARKPLVIMPIGDSITEGLNNKDGSGKNYRIPLFNKLSLAGYNVKSVGFWTQNGSSANGSYDPSGTIVTNPDWIFHSGKGSMRAGAKSGNGMVFDALLNDIDVAGSPDIVLLHIGINDMLNNASGHDDPDGVKTYQYITNMVTRAVNAHPEVTFVISSPMCCEYGHQCQTRPSASSTEGKDKNKEFVTPLHTMMTNFYAQAKLGNIPGITAQAAEKIYFADMYENVMPRWYGDQPDTFINDSSDKCHPNWLGHELMAQTWFDQITNAFQNVENPDGHYNADPAEVPETALGATNNVPAAYREGYVLARVFRPDPTERLNTVITGHEAIPYDYVNPDIDDDQGISKVAYFFEYVRPTVTTNLHRWVWADMDAFDTRMDLVGVPTNDHQAVVNNLHICGNHPAVWNIGADDNSVKGFVEFTPHGIGSGDAGVTGGPAKWCNYSWNDEFGTLLNYGCMQVHRMIDGGDMGREAQVVFAYNGFTSATTYPGYDYGIGNFSQSFMPQSMDWTFMQRTKTLSSTNLTYRSIEVWVKIAPTGNMTAEVTGEKNWSDITWTDAKGNEWTGLAGAYSYTLTGSGTTTLNTALADGATVTLSSGTLNLADGASIGATSTFSIAADATLGVLTTNVVLKASKVTNNGTIAFNGGTAENPIEITGDGNFGVTTLAANTHVYNKATANRKHLVTGVGATSYYYLDGHGLSDDTSLNNLTLVSLGTGNGVWIERGIGENVRLTVPEGKVVTIGNNDLTYNAPFIALNGAGTINPKKNSTLTIDCSEAATYSGTSSIAITIGGTAEQQLTGNYTGALTVNAGGQVKLTGSAVPSSITSAGTVTFDYGAETTKTVSLTSTGTVNILSGTVIFRDYRGAVTLGTDAKVGYTVNINDCGEFTVPQGVDINSVDLYRADGTKITTQISGNKLTYTWEITGSACYWDYEFNEAGTMESGEVGPINTGTEGTRMRFDGNRPDAVKGKEYVTNIVETAAGTVTNIAIRLPARPWRDVSSWPSAMTFVFYSQMVGTDKAYEISFGSRNNSGIQLFFATKSVADGTVDLCLSVAGAAPTILCTMSVQNAQDANHLYAVVLKKDASGNSVVNTYLDGELLQPYTHTGAITLGAGFQIASGHGDPCTGYGRPADDDPATMDWLRVYNVELTQKAMTEYANLYPYTSTNGKATRTVNTTVDTQWVEEGKWTQALYGGGSFTTNTPSESTAVELEVATATSLELNLDENAKYESLKIRGDAALTLTKGTNEDLVIPSVPGTTTIGTDVTVDYDAIILGNVKVEANKTLTFDLSNLDLTKVYANTNIQLTGAAVLEEGATITTNNLTAVRGHEVTLVVQQSQYHLNIAVTPEPFIYTIAQGEETGKWSCWGVDLAAEPDWAAVGSGEIQKAGDGTAMLAPQAGMVYNILAGTLKFSAVPTADCQITNVAEGATFDLNGLQPGSASEARGFQVTLNGGTLANSSASQGIVKGLTLVKDSTVDVASGNIWIQSGAGGYSRITLALGIYTLTKTGSGQFGVVETDVTGTGTIDIQAGMLWVQESSSFGTAMVKVGANGTFSVREGKTATVANVNGDGGTLTVAGTITGFELSGTLNLTGNGSYGTITNAADAVANIGTRHNYYTFSGAGNVKAKFSTDPQPGDVVTIFKVADSATTGIAELKKSDDSVIPASYYTYVNGVVTFKKEAKAGSTYYFTLKQAIEGQEAAATIELVADVTDEQSIMVGQNITLEGDTNILEKVTFSGTSTIVLNSGCIGIGWSERLSITNGICRFAEAVTNSWASHGPAEYSIAKLSTPVRADTTYQYEFVKSGFVPDPAKGEELIPVVDQNGNDAGAIKLNSNWVAEKTGESDPTQQAIALNTKETNKLMKWQNDVLGLTGSEEKSKPVPTPQQTADAAHLDFKLGGVNVAAGSGATVKYRVLAADTPGASLWTQTGGISNYTETVRVDLPKSGVKYYKLDVITETSK